MNGAPASGMNYQGGLAAGAGSPAAASVGGQANLAVGALVGVSLLLLLALHLLGFRFAFDVSVGRR